MIENVKYDITRPRINIYYPTSNSYFMGSDININGSQATINPCNGFSGAQVMATDLRASVSLVLASLIAKGETTINRVYHLDRGYENIENKLKKIGFSNDLKN